MRGSLALIGLLVMVACGGTPAASVAPTPSPTPVVTQAPTPSPTRVTMAERAAAHITVSVTELMNLAGNDAISDWISKEAEWLTTQPSLPVLRPYDAAITSALVDLIYMDQVPTDLSLTALKIIAAARQVPGVDLP